MIDPKVFNENDANRRQELLKRDLLNPSSLSAEERTELALLNARVRELQASFVRGPVQRVEQFEKLYSMRSKG